MSPPTPDPTQRRGFLPFFAARAIAGAARLATRASGRGGTALPGKVLLALSPSALRKLRRRLSGSRVVLVSATNGKTTLSAMLAAIAQEWGPATVHNLAGANLRSGLASVLMRAPRATQLLLLEVDEAALPSVARDLTPDVVVLGNLFRDQLDRYGELEAIGDRWEAMLGDLTGGGRTTVVYNADDPLIASLVRASGISAVAFGLEDPTVALAEVPHAADSKFCRACGTALSYTSSWLGHLGDWSCPECGLRRPTLDVAATDVVLEGLGATTLKVRLPGTASVEARVRVPGLYNAYNALGAVAAATTLGADPPVIRDGLAAFSPAFGRFERVPVPDGGSLTLLLVKNPTGLNEVIRTLTAAGVDLRASLFALNDGIADGRDVSWIWDADVEPLLAAAPGLVVTGTRAAEFALRAVYGGSDPDALVVEPDLEEALAHVLARARDFTEHQHAYALVTYTAMLELRNVVRRRGWVGAYWDERAAEPKVVSAP